MTPKEDIRTLAEFYPDATARHHMHVGFTHEFLPHYMRWVPLAFFSQIFNPERPGGKQDPTSFIQSWWYEQYEYPRSVSKATFELPKVFRRVSDLSMSLHSLAGRPAALVQMPKPEGAGEAYFVVLVLRVDIKQPSRWPAWSPVNFFALEFSEESKGATGRVCELDDKGSRHDLGLQIAVDRHIFLKAVEPLISRPPTRPATPPPSPPAPPAPPPPPAPDIDLGLAKMLAEPEFIAEPVFRKDIYLKQVAEGLFVTFLRQINLSLEEVEAEWKLGAEAGAPRNALMAKVSFTGKKHMVVAWTYDLDVCGPAGVASYVAMAKHPVVNRITVDSHSKMFDEIVLNRRVLRIQVEVDEAVIKSPPGAQLVKVKNIGWYVAALNSPIKSPPNL